MGFVDQSFQPLSDWIPSGVESAKERKLRLALQVALVCGASLAQMAMGMAATWPNPALADLSKDNTTIYGNQISFSPAQMDMLGSLVPVGVLPGTWLWGWLVATIGRRRSLLLLLPPYLLAWLLIALGAHPATVLAGRIVHGVCIGATAVAGGTYIIELPDIDVRGSMAVIPGLVMNLGFLLSVSLGPFCRWYEISFVGIGVNVIHFVVMLFLPESPTFLAISGREVEARVVLRRLRGPAADIDSEISALKYCNDDKQNRSLLNVLKEPATLKSLMVVMTLFFIQNFCGLMVFFVNATRIFIEAGSTLDESLSTILVFLVQFVGTLMACLYLDRFGRRLCIVVSLVVMAVCLFAMGTYMFLKQEFTVPGCNVTTDAYDLNVFTEMLNETSADLEDVFVTACVNEGNGYGWIPLACLMVYMFTSSLGIGPVPPILSTEYFPTAIRSQATGLCITVGSLLNFAALQLYSPMQSLLSSAGLYWLYGSVSLGGIFFTLVFVAETRHKAVG